MIIFKKIIQQINYAVKYLIVAFLLVAETAFAQATKNAEYAVKSSVELKDQEGVHMTINVRVKGSPGDNTVSYWFKDHEDRAVLLFTSDKKGQIVFQLFNLKHVKYIYVGGIGYVTHRLDLRPFKGKDTILEMETEPYTAIH